MKCSYCKKEGNVTEFYGWSSLCKECRKRYEWERSVIRKRKAVEYKGGKCVQCGYKKYYGALDFHHRDPSAKEFSWSKLRTRKWDSILKELDKCDLLCSNCHRENHAHDIKYFWFSHTERLPKKANNICKQCGNLFVYSHGNKTQKFCNKNCYAKWATKVDIPTKNELITMMKTMTIYSIAKQIGTGRKTVKKWALQYGLIT